MGPFAHPSGTHGRFPESGASWWEDMETRRQLLHVGLFFAVVGLGFLGAGCSNPECGGARTESDDAPVVKSFYLIDREMPGDPWTLIFASEFSDINGDLFNGTADFYINENNKPTSSRDLFGVFRQSGVAEGATSGTFSVALRFSDTNQDDFKVRLGLQLIDEAGNKSNCYSLELDFKVDPISSYTQPLIRSRRVACAMGDSRKI